MPIDIPPLREHKEDIPDLANFFWRASRRNPEKPFAAFRRRPCEQLMDFHWPGNVRELENIIERACALARGPVLEPRTFIWTRCRRKSVAGSSALLPEGKSLEQWEDEMIREAYRRANGNKSQAARMLGFRATRCAIAWKNRHCRRAR